MNAAYNGDITTENDYFCAPVSGQGYIDAGNFYNSGTEYMQDFLGKLNTYLRRADLSVTTIIGAENYKDGGIFGTMDAYASVGALKGGLVLNGGRYFEGAYSGGVYWKNGKPFIVPRDSLWSTTPAIIAARINKYALPRRVRTSRRRMLIPSSTCTLGLIIIRIFARSSICSPIMSRSSRSTES